MQLVSILYQQGKSLREIARLTGYPYKIVHCLIEDPTNAETLAWVRRHASAQPQHMLVDQAGESAPNFPHRAQRVSYERVEPFLDDLLAHRKPQTERLYGRQSS